jgi:thiol-disulfide isomerase/thioredoxin
MAKLYLLAISVLLISFQVPTPVKEVKVLKFNQFEPYLENKNDSVYLINFWATWCSPCIEELPSIEKAGQKYSDKKLKIILVSLDMPEQIHSRLYPFLRKNKIKSDVILLDDPDQNRWINLVNKDWMGDIPFTIIYSKNFRQYYNEELKYEFLDSVLNSKFK